MTTDRNYDVAILGTGIAGTMLGSILAKHGLNVLLLDSGSHPRFAIGEATTPDTSFRIKLLSAKYEVPEIANLSTFHKLRDKISPACGVKRGFSFLYHDEGKVQDPKKSHQYPTLAAPMGPDCHFFRQDTDAYMVSVAAQYGADVRQQTKIEAIDFHEDDVTLTSQKGEIFKVKYVVDGAGFNSPLAKKFDLREKGEPFQTNSRTIFNHMINVTHYDQIAEDRSEYDMKYRMGQTTLHHMFDGGWFWIIPFNNHEESVNPLCSVGLNLNREKYPETGMDPEEEFFMFVNKFPKMAKQFEKAKAIRTWVSTRRLQYSSTNAVGERYCILPHAAAFIDPLFSSGLNMTVSSIDVYAKEILAAFKEDDFSIERFQYISDRFQTNLGIFDKMVSNAYVSFQDYELWDAWYRVWVIALLVSTTLNANQYLKYLETKDRSILKWSEKEPYNAPLGYRFPESRDMFDKACALMDQVRNGQLSPKIAAAKIRLLFKDMNYCPSYWKWDDPNVRSTPAFTIWGMTKMYLWYYFKAPKHVKEVMYDWSPFTAYKYIFQSIRSSNRSSKKRKKKFTRDVFRAWNNEPSPETTLKTA